MLRTVTKHPPFPPPSHDHWQGVSRRQRAACSISKQRMLQPSSRSIIVPTTVSRAETGCPPSSHEPWQPPLTMNPKETQVDKAQDAGPESWGVCKRKDFSEPRLRVQSLRGKIPWRRAWQHTPVFLPGESHGQRSLGGYSPWGHKELDTTLQSTLMDPCIFLYAKSTKFINLRCLFFFFLINRLCPALHFSCLPSST